MAIYSKETLHKQLNCNVRKRRQKLPLYVGCQRQRRRQMLTVVAEVGIEHLPTNKHFYRTRIEGGLYCVRKRLTILCDCASYIVA